jgi:hypothetical protein
MTGAKQICSNCGHVGPPETITKGSLLIEIVLWLCFLLPGLIYSLWRLTSRTKGCRLCGSSALVPVDSPRGRELIARYPEPPAAEIREAGEARGRETLWAICIVTVVVVIVAKCSST